jgi:hypothetical protein
MNRVPLVALDVGRQVTAHLKWPFMTQERVETGLIQSIQDVGPARIVRVNGLDVFATGTPDSPGWFTDYDPPGLPVVPRARAQTPPPRPRLPKIDPTPPRARSTGARRRRRNQTRRRR